MKRKKDDSIIPGYDFTTPEARLNTVPELFEKAKNARGAVERDWEKFNNYYNFIHDASDELKEFCQESGIPWTPAVCPDPWIQVESQIDPNVPGPEFRGRDDDQDDEKAKVREFAVKFILENNDVAHMNTANERRLLKLGDAFWKAYWDGSMRSGIHEGDIRIKDVSPEAIFPDPALKQSGELSDGQYVAYVYTVHKVAFWQTYRKRLEKLGIQADEISSAAYVQQGSVFDLTSGIDDSDDTVQILEFWFKWPDSRTVKDADGNSIQVEEGRVACSIQAGDIELKLIPDYWKRTGKQCRLFPFIHYWRIRDENSFWNKSELYPIISMVDAADRKLGSALLNDAFMSNDIILAEKGAFAGGSVPENTPGTIWELQQGKIGAVARLGGLQSAGNSTILLNYIKEQIERTNRNYETNLGKETSRQTTATGLAMLREDAGSQTDIKASDRDSGFVRLFQLLDWLALEFYDEGRLLYLGVNKELGREEAKTMLYDANKLTLQVPEVRDIVTDEVVRDSWEYFPKIDVTVTAGDSVVKGKQATLNVLSQLTQAAITEDNWELYKAQLEIVDIPQKQEIIDHWQQKFGSGVPKELISALAADPQLLASVEAAAAQRQQMQQPQAIQPGGAPIDAQLLEQNGGMTE